MPLIILLFCYYLCAYAFWLLWQVGKRRVFPAGKSSLLEITFWHYIRTFLISENYDSAYAPHSYSNFPFKYKLLSFVRYMFLYSNVCATFTVYWYTVWLCIYGYKPKYIADVLPDM